MASNYLPKFVLNFCRSGKSGVANDLLKANFNLSVPKTLRFENAETLQFLFRGPKTR